MSDAEEQRALWNGTAGEAWVKSQELLDHILQPFEDALFEAPVGPRVLDVGCGTGRTTITAAKRGTTAVGIDISAPMLDLARTRAEKANVPATFILADAATHALDACDTIISRFGVMFFEDPVVAFQNLKRTGGKLRVIAWRSAAENEFMTTAERAVGSLLPLPPRKPGGPGQFAFGDRNRVMDVLKLGGWRDIDVAPLDRECTMPSDVLVPYVTGMGPVGRALRDVDDATRARVMEKLGDAFARFVEGNLVRFTAAGWMITAR